MQNNYYQTCPQWRLRKHHNRNRRVFKISLCISSHRRFGHKHGKGHYRHNDQTYLLAYYLITDKGTAFTSKLVAEVAQSLGLQMRCATTKHPHTIGKLERTHTSLETNLKMVSGDYRRQFHKYLPLAVLNYNTTYHVTLGCEPSRIFHGRIPYNILDHNLRPNPYPKVLPTTDFGDGFQRRTQILLDSTKKNTMQSYLKYKEYYDRKAKAAPLKPNDYCFILQPIADHQGSKIPFREYRPTGHQTGRQIATGRRHYYSAR